jgi:mRNA-degrading endonuclease RelE of RelBE toxin-antitoxin system
LPYDRRVQIVATRVYTRRVAKLLTEDERKAAEDEIAEDPLRWPVIRGTGGLRKARAARGSSGKSGGARIIFYYRSSEGIIYLLTIYDKSSQSDLSPTDKKALRKIVETLE